MPYADTPTLLSRRRFLVSAMAVAGGGMAAEAVLHRSDAAPVAAATSPDSTQSSSQGYRETEHTQAYYRAARF